jgi:tRNA(Arg) A34 adenosine deaminase TadA
MNGKIIAQGHNSYRNRTNDGFINNQGSCHAEISVLRSIFHIHSNKKYNNINFLNDKNHKNNKNIFKKISLYIVRCSYDLIFKNSAPCSECSKIIKLLDIKKIVYSNSSNNNNFIIVKPQDYFSDYKTLGRKQIDYKINNTKNKLKKIII